MATYLTRPGAWLTGTTGPLFAGLTPVGPPASGGLTPVGPPALAYLTPVGPPALANLTPVGPPAFSSLTPVGPPAVKGAHHSVYANGPTGCPPYTGMPDPVPWDGIDPAWVYASQGTLLGQALRKSRLKILRGQDDPQSDARELAKNNLAGDATDGSHLLRWGAPFRVSALQCELMGRFQVRGRSLWLIEPVAGDNVELLNREVFVVDIEDHVAPSDEQVDKVVRAAVEREDRLPEILSQADDFWPFFESVLDFPLSSAARVAELLEVAHGVALHLLMALKHNLHARRPMQVSNLVLPVIPTPAHGSMPSGHATMAALNAQLLGQLMFSDGSDFSTKRRRQLDALARRVAFNRVVAGLHYPMDNAVGYALGHQIGRSLFALAGRSEKGEPQFSRVPRRVDKRTFEAISRPSSPGDSSSSAELELRELDDPFDFGSLSDVLCEPAPGFHELWNLAHQELARLRR